MRIRIRIRKVCQIDTFKDESYSDRTVFKSPFLEYKDRWSYSWNTEFKSSFLKRKTEDNPHPSERVRVLNFTVQTQQNTVLNFITETGFQCPGIRNPEITRVYNLWHASHNGIRGIRNPEITRVYNRNILQRATWQGIRNPEITRVYNNHNDVSNVMCGIRYLEITMVFFCCYPKYGWPIYKEILSKDEEEDKDEDKESQSNILKKYGNRKTAHPHIREQDCFPNDYCMSCSRSAIIASFAWFEYLRTDASEMPSASAVFGPDHL